MTEQSEPEFILYDLGSLQNEPFSPLAWRIRLMLNYKGISYKTVFLEFPDIEPTLKGFGIPPHKSQYVDYTVPAIHHLATNTYLMDSPAISEFIEAKYPHPAVPLTSELGLKIQEKFRDVINPIFRISVMPRVYHIISPRAQIYFRKSRETLTGLTLEELDDPAKADQAWKSADADLRQLSDWILTHKDDGPFVLGAQVSYTDFWIIGMLEWARVANRAAFERVMEYPGVKRIHEACQPYMKKKD
ncbi:unnamed protein product [Clonostachys rosea]|uniref:GST N-terminal domain-containing protein n=1 Tax=Bionectria ochroleuca TaxID=29856 RepID=A0ABY6U4L1_BIOOC|nr:unnamed protein product [Clonostachys rosea]